MGKSKVPRAPLVRIGKLLEGRPGFLNVTPAKVRDVARAIEQAMREG